MLSSHANVSNTCLRILTQRGYTLRVEEVHLEDGEVQDWWRAEKDGYRFIADNPIELLGLAAIYEFKQPQGEPVSYWWVVEGDDLLQKMMDNAIVRPPAQGSDED